LAGSPSNRRCIGEHTHDLRGHCLRIARRDEDAAPAIVDRRAAPTRVTTEGMPDSPASNGALGTPSVKLRSTSTFAVASAVRGSATAPVIMCRPGSRWSARSATLSRKPPVADYEERSDGIDVIACTGAADTPRD